MASDKLNPGEIELIEMAFESVLKDEGVKVKYYSAKEELRLNFPMGKIMSPDDLQFLITEVMKALNFAKNITITFVLMSGENQIFKMKIKSSPKPIVN